MKFVTLFTIFYERFLSPNWWVDRSPGAAKKGKWCAVKPIPNPENKCVNFELVVGKKGTGTTIETDEGEYDPSTTTTISRGVGKCPNCEHIIDDEIIKNYAQSVGLGHQLYAVAFRQDKGSLEFRTASHLDFKGVSKATAYLEEKSAFFESGNLIPHEERQKTGTQAERVYIYGITKASQYFNPRQLLTLVIYAEIINKANSKIGFEDDPEKIEAIATYLGLILDRCVDKHCRLSRWHPSRTNVEGCSGQHALNLMWNYPESSGASRLWQWCAETAANDYSELCSLFGTKLNSSTIPGLE